MRNNWIRSVGLCVAVLALGVAACGPVQEPQSESLTTSVAALRDGEPGYVKPCVSSDECPRPFFCTTEVGDCNPPPGCDPAQEPCPTVCYGVCEKFEQGGRKCGEVICPQGTRCCNPLRNICVPPGFGCIQ